ncbi:endothelin-converting enzyme 2-like isoform X1 [Saccostrea echinata]|uniref:endothelin-converting enzyme 2-like isoform X1 n=1 Tax=Saccostrea echinata TaxID=191078 RepID=UPI002A80CF1B|nr:endothelin-converting enzyme 2-like isoform X1 [Saccostrea echinata]
MNSKGVTDVVHRKAMRLKKGSWAKSREKGHLGPSQEEQPLRSFNSQSARDQFSDVWNTDSDDELSWDEDIEYRSYTVKKKRNGRRPISQWCILVLLGLAVIIIAVLTGLIVWQHLQKSKHKQTYYSPDSVQSSAYIMSKMDQSVDPCQDFYQYTCGNWLKTTKIPPSRSHYSLFSEIADQNNEKIKAILEKSGTTFMNNHSTAIEKAKTYYSLCMDEKTIENQGVDPIIKFIRDLHSWSLTSAHGLSWSEASWDFHTALTTNHAKGFEALFSMGVAVDDKNSSQYIIEFTQSGLSLASREEYFTNHSSYQKIKTGFLEFGAKLGHLLGGENSSVWTGMSDIYGLETKLASIHVPKEELLDPTKTYHKMTVSEFQTLIGSSIKLTQYLKSLFGRDLGDVAVLVHTPKYFRQLGGVLAKTPKRTLANYIVWNALNSQVGYFPTEFVEAGLLLSKVESGIKGLDPRWQRCISKVNIAFGFASSALYVQEYFAKDSKSKVLTIVKEVEEAFIRHLPMVSWMDEHTRQIAKEKVQKIVEMIGYPDWILDTTKLDKYYENVTIEDGKFFQSHLNSLRESVVRNFNKLGTVPDREEWHMIPAETNAYYSQSYNQIVFPAAILQRPFFTPTFPTSFNFGTTGMIIGHEMTHGFDNEGRHYDKYGNLNNWWSNQSALSFQKETSCMVKQYSAYTAENTHLKGERVLGENIADNGGLKMAYAAYKFWERSHRITEVTDLPGLGLTPEQLFFVGFGQLWCSYYTPQYLKQAILTDPHTIGKFRTIGVVSNSGDFARAFNCPPNSPMNPQTKCQVW